MRAAAAVVFFLLAACASTGEENDDPAGAGAGPGETGGMCGGIAGFQCENEGDYCAMALGECERVADAAGVCTPRPEICTMDYRPVCGCDGETYSNPCAAAAKGVSIAYRGMCMD
ncbi:Kazal-type serine protease inhibitor family protein [Hyphococcus sp.]|uniref:Kazal-type serine protease inhibitor family protein n=1 Tax=Hyphococcus sp. TaxID=2038636 RepID=UPI0035C74A1B